MKKELELTLVEKYPSFFRDYGGSPNKTCLAWGFECSDGWYNLIKKLCEDLQKVIEKTNDGEIIVLQVKEKFGGLRFYYITENLHKGLFKRIEVIFRDFMFQKKWGEMYWKIVDFRKKFYKFPDEKISELVGEAEEESYKICELCGKPGKPSRTGWIRVLCKMCREN